jgi:hypothetical protein
MMTRKLLLGLLALASLALANGQSSWWTVQTVALRQVVEAEAEAERLRSLGFSAYTERVLRDGLEFIRVRVGCVDDRETADAWAGVLLAGVTAAAVPVPIEGAIPLSVPCVAVDIGFRKPERWTLVSERDEYPTFTVEIAGVTAHLRYQAGGWALGQGAAPPPRPIASADGATSVRQISVARAPVVMSAAGFLCPGTLLATVAEVAIIDAETSVVACFAVARD